MNNRFFQKLLLVVVGVCLVLTVIHVVYAVYAYQHASIVYFIAKELW